jgi:hypothetical protein
MEDMKLSRSAMIAITVPAGSSSAGTSCIEGIAKLSAPAVVGPRLPEGARAGPLLGDVQVEFAAQP